MSENNLLRTAQELKLELEKVRTSRQISAETLKIQTDANYLYNTISVGFERYFATETIGSTAIQISIKVYESWWDSLKATINARYGTKLRVQTRTEYIERTVDFRLIFPEFIPPPKELGAFYRNINVRR